MVTGDPGAANRGRRRGACYKLIVFGDIRGDERIRAHTGGQITFRVVTPQDSRRMYQVAMQHCRPVASANLRNLCLATRRSGGSPSMRVA